MRAGGLQHRVTAADLALLISSVFPRVEDPWPDTIGIELPFALAGAGGAVVGLLSTQTSETARNRAVRSAGLLGFRSGAVFYVLALVNQLTFGL